MDSILADALNASANSSIDLDLFQNDFLNLFVKQGDEYFNLVDKFKVKYKKKYLVSVIHNHNWSNSKERFQRDFSLKIINVLYNAFKAYAKVNEHKTYFDRISDIADIIFSLYLVELFEFDKNQEVLYPDLQNKPKSSVELIKMIETRFIMIGHVPRKESFDFFDPKVELDINNPDIQLNNFLDQLMLAFIKNTDPKFSFISVNLLLQSTNYSSFLSNKLILLYLHILTQVDFNMRYFELILTNVGLILKSEASALSKKINDLFYEDMFKDFDENDTTEVRQLNTHEFVFLQNNFFSLITFIMNVFEIDRLNETPETIHVSFSNEDTRKLYYSIVDEYIGLGKKPDYKAKPNIQKISKCYLLSLLMFDLYDFIYTNFYYTTDVFNNSNKIDLEYNPFKFIGEKICPRGYETLLDKSFAFFSTVYTSYETIVDIFLTLNSIHLQKEQQIFRLQEKEDSWYVIFVPYNHLGFSTFIWLAYKTNSSYKFIPTTQNPVLYFDLLLPCISSMIKKKGGNFRYMGLDLLSHCFAQISPETIHNESPFKNYQVEALFLDLMNVFFIETKKSHLVAKICNEMTEKFESSVKQSLFTGILKKVQENHSEKEYTFVIDRLKDCIYRQTKSKSQAFSFEFLKLIFNELKSKHEQVEIGILTTEVNFLNFVHELNYETKLYSGYEGYLTELKENLKEKIAHLKAILDQKVESFEKFLGDVDQKETATKEDYKIYEKMIESDGIRKNQALVAINLIETVFQNMSK